MPIISAFYGVVIRMFYKMKAGHPLESIEPLSEEKE
jgi:hypothetical protein